jgi:hypothetical protein
MTEERTLPERADGDPDLPAALSPNKPEPENWRRDARSKVTAAMPKLVDELINRSQKGSLGALGLASAGLERLHLAGTFRALPVRDGNDGESIVCYRSYLPAAWRAV